MTTLRLGALGLGRAGTHLAAQFHRLGYAVMAVNSAAEKWSHLDVTLPQDAHLTLGEGTALGAGKDPELARTALQIQGEHILAQVQTRFAQVDVLFVCGGLGGGMGSCVGELSRMLHPLGLPMLALVTLPLPFESAIIQVNGVRAAQELVGAPLLGRLWVDNARLAALFQDATALGYLGAANAAIVDTLHQFNRLSAREDLGAVRALDAEEWRTVWLAGGVLSPCIRPLGGPGGPLHAEALEAQVLAAMDGGDLFARGHNVAKANQLNVAILAPESVLNETRHAVWGELEGRLKSVTHGAAVRLGVYACQDGPAQLMVLPSFQELPARLDALMRVAQAEGEILAAKVHDHLPAMDVSALAGLSLSRVPPGRASRPPGGSIVPSTRASSAPVRAPTPTDDATGSPFQDPVHTHPDKLPGASVTVPLLMPLRAPMATALMAAPPYPTDELPDPAATGAMGAEELQAFYEDLVVRFRGAQDKRGRERVARRLMDDGRSRDEDVRALAVWAMVALGEMGFRKSLLQAAKDANGEVRRLAQEGLERLGGHAEGSETP